MRQMARPLILMVNQTSSVRTVTEIVDPASGKVIGKCPDMTLEDTRKAIQVAHDTFKTFRDTSPNARQQMLSKLYHLMEENQKDIARLIVWENGKSWTDAMGEAAYAASFFSWFSGEAVRTNGKTIPCSLPGTRNFSIKQPIGVCALLVP